MKRKLLFITLLMLFCSAVFGQQHWTMNNQGDYTIPMSVYANVSINGVPIKGANYEMAAFHGEELRGVAIPEYDSLLEQYIVTLTVYGKNNGDEISFKLFDPTIGDDGEELETDFKVGFRNDPVGQPIFPQSIDFYEPYFDFDAPSSVENYMGFGCAVKIDGVEQNRPNLEIAAFKENGEVCGYARSQALVGTNIYIFSLQIYAQNGETISFKLFDPTIGEDGDVLSTDYTIKCNVNYDSEAEIVYIDFKNNAVAKIGNNYYATLEAALAATMDNDVVTIIKSTNETIGVPAGNNVTIKALEGVELSGGAGGSYYNKSVTFDGLTFKGGKGIALTAGVDGITYTVKNCTFDGVQATAWKQGVISLNGNATVVVENNTITDVKNATEGDDRINTYGQQSAGIYTNNAVAVTISGNAITNVDGTGISSNSNAGKVDIKDNNISAWGTGATAKNEGRAIRTSGGTEVAITGNVMIDNGTAKEEFVKATGMTVSFDASENYWSGKNPLEEGIFDTDFAKDPAQIIDNYYTDAAKSNLVELAPSVAKIGDTYYATLEAALNAAQPGETVTILAGDHTADITINKVITVVGERDEQGENLVNITGRVSAHTGATVKNLNVNNTKTGDYDCALNVNGKDIVVDGVKLTGHNAMRYCYASGDITIKNSTINGSNFAVHFDGSAGGNIVFENTDITGWASYAGTVNSVSYTNCVVDKGSYSGHRYYNKNISFNECTFNAGLLIDLRASGSDVAFTDTDMTVAEVKALFKDPYYVANGNVTLNDVQVTYAASGYTANGSKYFDNLQDAIDEVNNGGYITVRSNIELTQGVTVPAGKKITLGLNGYTITGTPTEAAAFAVITNNGNLTIDDTQNGGKILCNHNLAGSTGYAVNTITNSGTLTIVAGTIQNTSTASNQIGYAIDNNSTSGNAVVVIKGGKVTASGSVYYDGIRQFCNSETLENNVTIDGGEVSTLWIQNPSDGSVTQNTKDVKGSFAITDGTLGNLYLEPSANFSGSISGGHVGNISRHQTAEGRDLESFITGGTFGMDVTEFCAEGFTAKPNDDGTYDVRFADYIVLPTGMDESNYETLFGTNTVTDGTNYYATLQAAVESVVGTESTLYCKPGADVGSLQHAPVTNTLTVYGNGAFVSGDSERDFDLGNTDPSGGQDITSDMTLTVKYLDGCGAWGTKATEHTVNLVFENCYNMGKVFVTGTTGTLNITMNNCAFEGVISEALYSNADGTIALTNVAFSNLNKAINLNHKAAGTQTVTLENCTFTKCGNDVAADQIPVRVLSSVPGGKSELTVTSCTFTGTPTGGADILLDYGVGITTATVSNTVAYVVVEREDNVQTDNDKTTTSAAQTYTFDNRPYVAEVGEVSYKTIAEALAAVQDGGTITLINNVTEEFAINNTTADITLDMAGFTLNGNIQPSEANLTIKNGTINNENASYSAIEINAGTLVLNDVKVTSKRHGVRIDGAVEATINGGEYRLSATSGTRHAVNVSGAADVTIKAGTFVGPKGTTMDSGSAVCVQSGATVTIEGGDFSGGKNATLGVSGKMIVKGGTFDQVVNASHLAEGYVCQMNADNKYEVFFAVAQIGETYYETIQEAVDAAVVGNNAIQLLANIDGDVTILQQEGINIVIDGKKNETENYTFNGTINVYGNARNTGTETLKIQNVNFYTEDSGRYFIEANEIGQISGTNNFKQYAHNVTVENCNFATSAGNTNNTVVGMRFRQAYNMSAVNCTSDGIFSIMWTTAVDGLTLTDVVATNCKEGITIGGASKKVNITGTTIKSETYAIRAEGAGSDFTIKDSTLEAKVPVVVREVTDNSKISFTFNGTNTITESNPTTSYWFVAGAGAAYQGNENEQLPVIKGQVTVVLNDTDLSYDGVYGNYGVAKIGDVVYTTFNDAYNAATEDNNVITLLDDITLTETVTIEKAITLDLGANTVTGADGAIVFNVKAATTIKNGIVIGNKSGASSGLIDIYANLNLDGVTIETSKIYALRFKAGECTATLTNCNVTGAFKGYGGSVWEIKSGTYKAASTSINDQLNGTASISGGTFYYEIAEEECAPGYVVMNNGDGTWTVEYTPAAFVDADNDGILDEGEKVYGNLEQIFNNHKEGDVHVVLTANIKSSTQVDTDADAHYYFTTNVVGGVTMDFLYEDNWNYIQKMTLGKNITLNAKHLLAWTTLNVSGTINTDYLYTLEATTTINESGVVNANTGDATIQVKDNATFIVNGTVNTAILNVWVNDAKLIVDGANAKVNASWVDIWDGTPSVTVQNGATLDTSEDNGIIKASRGGSITVDNATLTGKIELGHNGESAGELTVTGNSTLSPITLTVVGSTVSGPENLTVTSGVNGYGVNYFNGVYSLVEIEIQETELFKGWNWFSAYVDINGEEGLTKVQNALDGNATLMKSHTAFGTYYNGMWYNNGGDGLSSASVTEMYMIQMETAMTGENKMQLEGNLVNPSEHTIQLNQNWNWIGYPSNEPINLENAFNGFTPQNGDRIKSHVGFSQYYGEGSNDFGITGWWGTLEAMTPGLGYMYYREGEGTASFTYNVPADGAKSELRANITADDNYWVPATHRYANNMTMVAMLEGANADNYEVAAFVDGEVRGSARPVYVEPLDAYMFFLTIYGDEVEEMSFRCYDLATGEEYAINDRINYSVDAMLGSIEEPYMFRGTVGIGEATLSEINIYPNPTTTGREISFDATCETVEVFNTLGVKVAEYHYVDTIDAFETAGIYMIRITNNGNVQNCRVVVK